jgi:hypothetical protein
MGEAARKKSEVLSSITARILMVAQQPLACFWGTGWFHLGGGNP